MTFTLNDAGLRRLIESPDSAAVRDVLERARRVEARAKALAPVDTGRLRASIHIEGPVQGSTGVAFDVVAATEYSIYVHDGTRFMRGRPFLTDALSAAVGG